MSKSGRLSGSHGSVLDPIVAIQCEITLDPEQSVTIDMAFGMSDSRETVLSLVE
jgi:cellobiose phosphorylase